MGMAHKGAAAFIVSMVLAFAGITGAMAAEECSLRAANTGDLDGDCRITAVDAQSVLSAYANILAGDAVSLTNVQKQSCDIDGDRELTAADAQFILMYYTENHVTGNPITWDSLLEH